MKRRAFITLLGGAAASWPLAARAQQAAIPVIGFLRSTTFADTMPQVIALRQGLKEAGFVEGQNVAVEYHAAEGKLDRLQALVADLIRRPVAVIVADNNAALAAKAATTMVPIVFGSGGDSVGNGLVGSLNRPGGNVTGVSFLAGVLGAKRLELLRQLVPGATTVGFLVDPRTNEGVVERRDVETAAKAAGQQLYIVEVRSDAELEQAFAAMAERKVGAVLIGAGAFFTARHRTLAALALRHRLPAARVLREFAEAGGLMSYGTSITDAYRQAGVYAGRILKGENPGELPVLQSAKFEFVVNLATAKALGLTVPMHIHTAADEVIE
jgi:putative ABC transport system substrate-binding protein